MRAFAPSLTSCFALCQHTACVGLGVFHSGVEVYGKEYAYGGHEFRRVPHTPWTGQRDTNLALCPALPSHAPLRLAPRPLRVPYLPLPLLTHGEAAQRRSTSGVFETPPRVVPGGARFRETIVVGSTNLSAQQVEELLKRLSREYLGDRYHLLYRNVRPNNSLQRLRSSHTPANTHTAPARSATISAKTCVSS